MSKGAGAPWESKIVGYGEEPPESLLANPLNSFKIHPRAQRLAIAGALTELGWLAPVVVNRLTNHCLDGHARIEEAISRGEPTVPIVYVELDPALEAEALATFDPLGAMVAYDKAELETLLRDVTTTDEALMAMLGELAAKEGVTPPDVDFKEYDESVESEVEYLTCPSCGHKWPK